MIRTPIKYQGQEKSLVDAFNARQRLIRDYDTWKDDSKYWEEDEVTPVRTAIKKYYETAQEFCCCYCGVKFPTSHGLAWQAEHIIARSTHPQFLFEPENLAVSCIACNATKGDASVLVGQASAPAPSNYPRSSGAFTIVHPHYDDFNAHIAVHLEGVYRAKTDKGASTICLCGLLRYGYKCMGWDERFASKGALMELHHQMMDAKDETEINAKLQDMLMVKQVHLSRSLLAVPTNHSDASAGGP